VTSRHENDIRVAKQDNHLIVHVLDKGIQEITGRNQGTDESSRCAPFPPGR